MDFSSGICKEISVASKEIFAVDYSEEYKKFDKI
jgi:hypothetical protein